MKNMSISFVSSEALDKVPTERLVNSYKRLAILRKTLKELRVFSKESGNLSNAYAYMEKDYRMHKNYFKPAKDNATTIKTVKIGLNIKRSWKAISKKREQKWESTYNYRTLKDLKGVIKDLKTAYHNFRVEQSTLKKHKGQFQLFQGKNFTYEKIAGIRVRPGTTLEFIDAKKAFRVYQIKSPKTNDKYIGVEIEFTSKSEQTKLGAMLHKAGLGDFVHLKSDGSIQVKKKGHYPHELCVLVTEANYKEIINKIANVLLEDEATVNASCGLHVHLDMRNRNKELAYSNLVSAQNILYAMNPKSRSTSQYCQKAKFKEFGKHSGRYMGINAQSYNKYNTIEVRIHAGTVSGLKIINWVGILLSVINLDSEVKRSPGTVTSFIKTYKVEDNLAKYIAERVLKFTEKDPTVPVSVDAGSEDSEVA